MSNAAKTQLDEYLTELTAIRAAKKHYASGSIQGIDPDALLNDPVVMKEAGHEAAMIGATVEEVRQQVRLERLERLRLGGMDVDWSAVVREVDANQSWLDAHPISPPGEVVEPKRPADDVTVPERVPFEPAMASEGQVTRGATPPPAAPSSGEKPVDEELKCSEPNLKPARYLFEWPDILDRIGQPDERKAHVIELNRKYQGPIIITQGSSKPKVEEGELLRWWNGLADLWKRESRQSADVATEPEQYQHGKETVVPGIGGHTTKRVKGRNSK